MKKIQNTELGNIRHCGKLVSNLAGYGDDENIFHANTELRGDCYDLNHFHHTAPKQFSSWYSVFCDTADHDFCIEIVKLDENQIYARIFQSNFLSCTAREGLKHVKWITLLELQEFFQNLQELEKLISKIGKDLAKRLGLHNRKERRSFFKAHTADRRVRVITYKSGGLLLQTPDGRDILEVDQFFHMLVRSLSNQLFGCFSQLMFIAAIGWHEKPWFITDHIRT